jgi:hypothetical protein
VFSARAVGTTAHRLSEPRDHGETALQNQTAQMGIIRATTLKPCVFVEKAPEFQNILVGEIRCAPSH